MNCKTIVNINGLNLILNLEYNIYYMNTFTVLHLFIMAYILNWGEKYILYVSNA